VLPLFLDLGGVPVLVVGGGSVAERKIASLLGAGGRVTVVSPNATKEVAEWARQGRIAWEQRAFAPSDVSGMRLAFAATSVRKVNAAVAQAARDAGVWVNVADSHEESTAVVPSVVQRGALAIAVSTGGSSPLLSTRIRRELEARYGPEYADLCDLMSEARRLAGESIPSADARRRYYEALLDSDLLDLLRAHKSDAARERLTALLAVSSRD